MYEFLVPLIHGSFSSHLITLKLITLIILDVNTNPLVVFSIPLLPLLLFAFT